MHVFLAPADPVPEGTMTGEASGATTSRRDSRDSTGVRSAMKRKRSDTDLERGMLWGTGTHILQSRNLSFDYKDVCRRVRKYTPNNMSIESVLSSFNLYSRSCEDP